MRERNGTDQVKYIHGNYGRGTFTFYGGHDPEDYQHAVGDPPTDLILYKNSPGYQFDFKQHSFPRSYKKEAEDMKTARIKNSKEEYTIGKIVCVGRNYAEHAKELGNEVPDKPVLFLKPASAIIYSGGQIIHPDYGNELHHEVELVLLIGETVKNADRALKQKMQSSVTELDLI